MIRVRLDEDVFRESLNISISPERGKIIKWSAEVSEYDETTEPPPDTALVLPEDIAKELYEALAKYFVGMSDVAQMAETLRVERRRFDKVLDKIVARL